MRFPATLLASGKTATGIEVPPQVVEELGGGKRAKVAVTLNGYTYRTSIAVMGGRYLIPVSAEVRAGAGVTAGDELEVEAVLDDAPRAVDVPADLAAALARQPAAGAAFAALSYSHQRRHVLAVEAAKGAETRARRVAAVVAAVAGGPR
jgi:hypothetical protein